ncbi:unnamed protein product [Closterium sp. NIES-54]
MAHQILQRFGFPYSSPQSTPLPLDESVEPSEPTSGMGLVLGGRGPVVLTRHVDASWVDDLATQRTSQGYTFSLGSDPVSWCLLATCLRIARRPCHLLAACLRPGRRFCSPLAACLWPARRLCSPLATRLQPACRHLQPARRPSRPARRPPSGIPLATPFVASVPALLLAPPGYCPSCCAPHFSLPLCSSSALPACCSASLAPPCSACYGFSPCTHFRSWGSSNPVLARYSSPTTAALGRLLLHYLFPELSAFAMVEDLVTHLRTSNARYCAALLAEFLDRNPPPMYITLYFIVTRLPDSLHAVRDHFLALDPTDLTVDLLEQHLLAAETSVVAVGAACGTPRMSFFEGCSPFPLAPSYASAAAVDILGAASALSGKRCSSKGKGGRSGGGGSGGGGCQTLFYIVYLVVV